MSSKFIVLSLAAIGLVIASHAQPALGVEYSSGGTLTSPVNLGTVEVMLRQTVLIKVANTNTGLGGPLNVNISIVQSGLNNNTAHWMVALPASPTTPLALPHVLSLPTGSAAVELAITFRPTGVGDLPVLLRMTTNGTPATVDFQLNGTGQKANINFGLVLDQSGSMSQTVSSTTTRLDLLKAASRYFVDLLATRSNSGDQLAAVAYSSAASPLISKGPLNTVNAKATLNGLSASGSTATGSGLELANSELGAAAAGSTNVTILFTDGEENVGPPWMNGANTVNSSRVFTIGMGSLVTSPFQTALSNYAASKNGGYYYVPETTVYTAGSLPIDLQKAYLGIFTDASGMTGVIDPVYEVPLTAGEKLVASAWMTSSDQKALFSVFFDPAVHRLFDLEMRSPKGTVLTNGTFGGNLVGSVIRETGYEIFTVIFANATDESEYVGKWDLYLKPKDADSGKMNGVSIGFATSTLSDLKLQVGLGATNYVPGSALNIGFDFTDGGVPVSGVRDLIVQLTTPSGQKINLNPIKDTFDKWVISYPHTYEAGTYQLFVRATVANSKGQVTTREQTRYYAFGYPPVPTSGACISCLWIRIVVVLVILLLLIILIRIRKK